MAALFESLAVTGSRLATGVANASGKAWFYEHGSTTTLATVYEDADEEATSANPVTLDAAGKATVYLAGMVDVRLEDSTGAAIGGTLALTDRAERVEVRNAGFTGLLPSGSQGAGGATDLDAILTSLFVSLGGLDGKYKEFTGATGRGLQSVIRGIQVSVKDYGAVGNGVADDTVAIQAAINEVARLGGGVVYFDPGTYVISAPLTVTNTNGVSIRGCGGLVSIIKNTNAGTNALTLDTCSTFFVEDIGISHATGSTGAGISLSACDTFRLLSPRITGHQIGIDIGGLSNLTFISGQVISTTTDAASRAIRFNTSGAGASGHYVSGGSLFGSASGKAIEFNGTVNDLTIVGVYFNSNNPSGIYYNIGCTGSRFTVAGCPSLGALATPIDTSALSNDPQLRQWGNRVDGYTQNVASGATATVDRSKGPEMRIRATSTGVAIVIPAPSPVPTSGMRDVYITLRIFNNAGGAMTAYTMNAVYHLTAVPSTVDLETTTYRLLWDPDRAIWSEQSRAVTT